VDYIDTQFEKYLQEELKIKRSLFNYHDGRIHICLYFIAPTGHSLKSLDLVTMKKLDSKVKDHYHQCLVGRKHTPSYCLTCIDAEI
jgi:septin family protein